MLKKYQDHIPFSFAYKLVCVDDRFNKPIDVFRGKNAAFKFIEAILKDHEYCKKVMKKHFNIIDNDDEKVRDNCHITGKFRNAAHWRSNINFQ